MSLSSQPVLVPLITDSKQRTISKAWASWLWELAGRTDTAAYAVMTQEWDALAAALPLTVLVPTAAAGLYRVAWFVRIVGVASVSSSVTVSVTATDGGVAYSLSGAAITGNTTATAQGQSVIVRADGSTPIQISTAYVSNAAGEADYDLAAIVERL